MVQIRFPETVCVSGIKIGGVPTAGTGDDAPFVRVFAKSASLLSSARFSCLLEHEHLPELQTTKAVRFEVIWLLGLEAAGAHQRAIPRYPNFADYAHRHNHNPRTISNSAIGNLWMDIAYWPCSGEAQSSSACSHCTKPKIGCWHPSLHLFILHSSFWICLSYMKLSGA